MDTETPEQPHRTDRAGAAGGGGTLRRASGSAGHNLRLLPDGAPPSWRLSEATREAGRRGVAAAREALRTSRRRAAEHHADPTADAA